MSILLPNFQLSADLSDQLVDFSDAEKGLLFEAILRYCNGTDLSDSPLPPHVMNVLYYVQQELNKQYKKKQKLHETRSNAARGIKNTPAEKATSNGNVASPANDKKAANATPATSTTNAANRSTTANATNGANATIGAKATIIATDTTTKTSTSKSIDYAHIGNDFDVMFRDIIDTYHQICPNSPHVDKLTEKIRRNLLVLIDDYALEDFQEVFHIVSANDFLLGKTEEHFLAQFNWIIQRKNFEKIKAGAYAPYSRTNVSSRPRRNPFNAIEAHEYDFEALEKELLDNNGGTSNA